MIATIAALQKDPPNETEVKERGRLDRGQTGQTGQNVSRDTGSLDRSLGDVEAERDITAVVLDDTEEESKH